MLRRERKPSQEEKKRAVLTQGKELDAIPFDQLDDEQLLILVKYHRICANDIEQFIVARRASITHDHEDEVKAEAYDPQSYVDDVVCSDDLDGAVEAEWSEPADAGLLPLELLGRQQHPLAGQLRGKR